MSGNYRSLSDDSKKYRCNASVIRILLGCYRVSYFATTKVGTGSFQELLRAQSTGLQPVLDK